MKIVLNKWQTWLLFLPFVASILITNFAIKKLAIANLLMAFNIALLLLYQAHLVVKFNKDQPKPSKLAVINALIPATALSLYVLYLLFKVFQPHKVHMGPVNIGSAGILNQLVVLILIYAFANYFFLNRLHMKNGIKKIGDQLKQEELIKHYLLPVQQLISTTIIMFGILILVTFISDIIKLISHA